MIRTPDEDAALAGMISQGKGTLSLTSKLVRNMIQKGGSGAMPDVFVSYKREDKAVADRIANKLQKLGLDVWIDSRLAAGEAFDAGIETALREAKAVLVLWSPASVSSEWVRNEASVGKDRGVLVALMIEPCEPPLAFRSTHYELMERPRFGDDDLSWGRIVERVQLLVGRHAEVAKLQRKRIRKAKRGRTIRLLLAWALALVPMGLAAGYVANSSRPISPGPLITSLELWDRGAASFKGTWDAPSEPLYAPVNYVNIECDRERRTCIEAEGYILPNSPALGGWITQRTIIKWDESVIVTSDDYPAATHSMTISRPSESVTAVRFDKCDNLNTLCIRNGRVDYRLIDGSQRALRQSSGWSSIAWLWATALLTWTLFTAFRIFRVWRLNR